MLRRGPPSAVRVSAAPSAQADRLERLQVFRHVDLLGSVPVFTEKSMNFW